MSRTGTAASIRGSGAEGHPGRRLAAALLVLPLTACGLGKPVLLTESGRLAACDWARCVSSLDAGPRHRVEPIRYTGSRDAARNALLRIIGAMDGALIVTQTPDYVHAEFTTKLLRAVDDLELVFPEDERLVHLRSASRVGLYDFDDNRERVERIRASFEELQP